MNSEAIILLQRQITAAEGWLGLGDYQSAEEELALVPEELQNDPWFQFMSARIRTARLESSSPELDHPAEYTAPSLLTLWVKQAYGPQVTNQPPKALHLQSLV